MLLEHERLRSLIQFAQSAGAMRATPVSRIESHKDFAAYEHTLQGVKGVHFNTGDEDSGEIWLTVDRLYETKCSRPTNPLLKVWLESLDNPTKAPTLKESVDAIDLKEAGLLENSVSGTVFLNAFDRKEEVASLLKAFTKTVWTGWAEEEKQLRRTIELYGKLFTLKQQLEGAIVDGSIEIVWGVGITLWNKNGTQICYPLISHLIDIAVNEKTMAIEISPRNVEPRLELDIYAESDNPNIGKLETAWQEFNKGQTQSFSPFDSGCFDGILRYAATTLDAKGKYWPDFIQADDRSIPPLTDELKITDTWAVFARPRNRSLFVQDLERFKEKIELELTTVAGAAMKIFTDPLQENQQGMLPSYRGMSTIHGETRTSGSDVKELYFSLPYNDEQVRIVQLLENNDGVVVQGPPGTGKTHTIANIICHYFALGKRILVTSMKEPALKEVRDKLPAEVRPLAISLLTSEKGGTKQFEDAVYQISSEIQRIDMHWYRREIEALEKKRIDGLHAKLSSIDTEIEVWAKKNLMPIVIADREILPEAAAKMLVENAGTFEWLNDDLEASKNFSPQFGDQDIATLRVARRSVASDLEYLEAQVPEIDTLLPSKEILSLHQTLSRHAEINDAIEKGDVLKLREGDDESIKKVVLLQESLLRLDLYRIEIAASRYSWTDAALEFCRQKQTTISELWKIFDDLSEQVSQSVNERNKFVSKPVILPDELQLNDEVLKAVRNRMERKLLPFGIVGLVGKSSLKATFQQIRIVTSQPASTDDWAYVYDYLSWVRRIDEILVRWNSIAPELKMEPLEGSDPQDINPLEEQRNIYSLVRDCHLLEQEVQRQVLELFPASRDASQFIYDSLRLNELKESLEAHVSQHESWSAWASKQDFLGALSRYTGQISEDLRFFVNKRVGNPKLQALDIQHEWTALNERLRHVHSLRSFFDDIRSITAVIGNSGATVWAARLRTEPPNSGNDQLLPNNWRQAWELRQISHYLNAADGRIQLKKLFSQRTEAENQLGKAYRELVVKKTWLKLAENATPEVRSALEAYRSSIAKIGKGTGKRAPRHRQDARKAAEKVTHAIPCWIMQHDRISESLPPDFGCFDLVIIDEASQSDLTALPALLRARKLLVVGDDKQVSPGEVGLEEDKIKGLVRNYLSNQVELYRPQMTPERSIYDLFKVVFASSSTILREHFRCVAPIIEYSKREFYNHELTPVRLAKSSERLDPPLIDVFIKDGFKKNDINPAEARFIVDEIKRICADEAMSKRTIGVVSLLKPKQAQEIWRMLEGELGPDEIQKHKIECGNARTFQGKERDIIFLSMVCVPNDAFPKTDLSARQEFNVAASRAENRMYLVRSVGLEHLSPKDSLRKGLINHFTAPFLQNEEKVADMRQLCESGFEKEIYDLLTERGYNVTPQVPVGGYRIDMVVEGNSDARLAIECDGDQYHGPDKWPDDIRRQRILERVGWRFWRCFASDFVRDRKAVIEDLITTLSERGIEPIGSTSERSPQTESRAATIFPTNHETDFETNPSPQQSSLTNPVGG